MDRFDYVIVGAGPAGCVLANRLTEDPSVRVALIEAGPDHNARKALVRIPLAMVTFMAPALAFLGGPKFVFEEAGRILRDGGFPTRTLLCANDRVAFGVLAAMYQAGLKVGFGPDRDFRVAGHDNQRLSAYTCPPLTTVSQDCEQMGRVALSMLLERIGSGEPAGWGKSERVLLDAALVLRKSA